MSSNNNADTQKEVLTLASGNLKRALDDGDTTPVDKINAIFYYLVKVRATQVYRVAESSFQDCIADIDNAIKAIREQNQNMDVPTKYVQDRLQAERNRFSL